LDGGGGDGLQKSMGHGLFDSEAADVEAVLPASLDDVLAGTVIARS
jgi:hypothetical protein